MKQLTPMQKYIAVKEQQLVISGRRFSSIAALNKAQQEFVIALTTMRHRAMELGLAATSHELHAAVKIVGYELAGDWAQIQRIREKKECG